MTKYSRTSPIGGFPSAMGLPYRLALESVLAYHPIAEDQYIILMDLAEHAFGIAKRSLPANKELQSIKLDKQNRLSLCRAAAKTARHVGMHVSEQRSFAGRRASSVWCNEQACLDHLEISAMKLRREGPVSKQAFDAKKLDSSYI